MHPLSRGIDATTTAAAPVMVLAGEEQLLEIRLGQLTAGP